MSFQGPKNSKSDGNLGGRLPNQDGIGLFIAGGVAVSGGYELGTVLKCIQVSDAVDVGLDAAYDVTNKVLVYNEIAEFFEIAPNGTLYVMLVAQGTTMAEMFSTANMAKAAILSEEANREIKFIGCKFNPNMSTYTAELEEGYDKVVREAVIAAQALIDALELEEIYVDNVFIEGREFNGTIAVSKDWTELTAPNVSVCIGQDPAVAALHADFAKTAAIGSLMGAEALRQVNESIASLELLNKPSGKESQSIFPLTRAASGRWLAANLSSGASVRTLTLTERKALSAKHVLYMGMYEYADGVFINGDYTAIADTSDFARINSNRVWNKAVRLVSTALTPKINSTVLANSDGTIDSSTVLAWQLAGERKLREMMIDGEVSALPVLDIDPAQNFLANKTIKYKLAILPTGVAEAIEGEVGFTNPLTA